jgi:hypothetical protein
MVGFPHAMEGVWTLAEDQSVYVVERGEVTGSCVVTEPRASSSTALDLSGRRVTVRKSHSRMLPACWRRNSDLFASSRFGAGSIPASFKIVQAVLAASLMPSPTSSPWIRRYPTPGSPVLSGQRSRAPRAALEHPAQRRQ